MSYQIFFRQMNDSSEYLLYDTKTDDLSMAIAEPKLSLELSKAGKLEFSIYPNHRYFDSLHKISTYVRVEYNEEEIFRGRVLNIETGIYLERKITCEGDLSYLVDSLQSPDKTFVKDSSVHQDEVIDNSEQKADLPADIRDQLPDEELTIPKLNLAEEHSQNESVYAHFARYIVNHNQQVDENRRFRVGTVTVDDPTITRKFSSSNWRATKDALDSDLIKYYGGYLQTRPATNGGYPYIDYLLQPSTVINQPIRMGVNMIDLTEHLKGEDIFTVFVPIGKDGLTVASVNDGSIGIEVPEGVSAYGKIYKTETYGSVTTPEELMIYGQAYIEANYKHNPITINVKAVDINLIDNTIDRIRVGSIVNVVSSPHNLNGYYVCTKIEYDLQNPDNNEYEIGDPSETLSHKNNLDKLSMSEDVGEANARSSYSVSAGYDAVDLSERLCDTIKDVASGLYTIQAKDLVITADLFDLNAKTIEIEGDAISIKSQTGVPGSVGVFDVGKAYNPGDYVMYGGILYRFKAQHPAGRWNFDHVYAVPSLSSEIAQNKEGIASTVKQTGVVSDVKNFSATYAYRTGDFVYYPDIDTGGLYRFTADHTGAWIGTDATPIDSHETRITQTARNITLEVQRATGAESTLDGKIDIEAGKIRQIVTAVGSDGTVTAASIVTAINDDDTSGIRLDADKIELSSSGGTIVTLDDKVSVLGAMSYQSTNLYVNGDIYTAPSGDTNYHALVGSMIVPLGKVLQFSGDAQTVTSVTLNNSSAAGLHASAAVASDTLTVSKLSGGTAFTIAKSGNNLVVTDGSGGSFTFSKAISSWTGSWDGNILTVTASPQNQNFTETMGITITPTPSGGAASTTIDNFTSLHHATVTITASSITAAGGTYWKQFNVDASSVWNAGGQTAWLTTADAAGTHHQGTLASNRYYCPRYQDADGNIQTLSDYTWLTPTSGGASSSVDDIELNDSIYWIGSDSGQSPQGQRLRSTENLISSHINDRGYIQFSAKLDGVSGTKWYYISIG